MEQPIPSPGNDSASEESLQLTRKVLLAVFWLPMAICLALAALFELEVVLPGQKADDAVFQVYVVGLMEVLTICLIPLALRLFKFGHVARALHEQGPLALRTWGIARLDMITIPMVANTLSYYLTLNVAFGYLAIIGLLVLPFVYPSEQRCRGLN